MPQPIPASVDDMHAALMRLMRQREKSRFSARRDYSVCELWRMDNPPDTFEYSAMADRLDVLVGFHLTDMQIMEFYDFSLAAAAVYLFNMRMQGPATLPPPVRTSSHRRSKPR
jgi:hypothetical protein